MPRCSWLTKKWKGEDRTMTEEEKKALELQKEQRAANTDLEEGIGEDTPPETDNEDRNQSGLKRSQNETREEIMRNASARRRARRDSDTEQLDEEGKRRQAAMEAEVRGEEHEFDAKTPPETEFETEEQPDAAEKKTGDDVDSADDLVTITVEGEEQQVSRSAVEKAGIAALQKESTADKRLKEVSRYEESVRQLEASVRQQIDAAIAEAGKKPAAADDNANLPDEGAVAEAIQRHTDEVAAAIYSGDQDQVKESLASLVTSVAQGRQSSTPPLDAKEFAEAVITNMRASADLEAQERAQRDQVAVAEKVNTTFKTEFSDLYDDDRGFALTKAEFDVRRSENPGADPVALMREAATSVKEMLAPPAPAENILDQRRRAARAAETPPSSTQRVPPQPPKKKPTRADAVAAMRKARGQP